MDDHVSWPVHWSPQQQAAWRAGATSVTTRARYAGARAAFSRAVDGDELLLQAWDAGWRDASGPVFPGGQHG